MNLGELSNVLLDIVLDELVTTVESAMAPRVDEVASLEARGELNLRAVSTGLFPGVV